GYYNMEIFVPLKPFKDWPVVRELGRPRTKEELLKQMNDDLDRHFPGVDWDFSQIIRDNVMEALSGVKGENSIKVFGPDLDELERIAEQVKGVLADVPGVTNAGVFRIKGQSNLEFPIDRDKCAAWNVAAADVENVIATAVGGKSCTQVIEGERTFDVTLRWPEALRNNEQAILNIPVDVVGHNVAPLTGANGRPGTAGTSQAPPALTGSQTS